jgi:hypothetical protein
VTISDNLLVCNEQNVQLSNGAAVMIVGSSQSSGITIVDSSVNLLLSSTSIRGSQPFVVLGSNLTIIQSGTNSLTS